MATESATTSQTCMPVESFIQPVSAPYFPGKGVIAGNGASPLVSGLESPEYLLRDALKAHLPLLRQLFLD
jgi:hypothetical protein